MDLMEEYFLPLKIKKEHEGSCIGFTNKIVSPDEKMSVNSSSINAANNTFEFVDVSHIKKENVDFVEGVESPHAESTFCQRSNEVEGSTTECSQPFEIPGTSSLDSVKKNEPIKEGVESPHAESTLCQSSNEVKGSTTECSQPFEIPGTSSVDSVKRAEQIKIIGTSFVNMAAHSRRPVSSEQKQRIVDLHRDGKSTSVIASIVRRSASVVKRIVAKYKCTGSIESPHRSGRPRKTSLRQDRVITRRSLQGRFKSFAAISRDLSSTSDVKVSRQTVSRRLRDYRLHAKVPAQKI